MQELLDRELPPGGEPRWHAGRRIALYRHCPEGSQARSREYPELLYLVRGRARLRIGTAAVTLEQGELLLLGQNTPVELLPMEPGAQAVSFLVKPELLADILSFLGSEETPLRVFVLKCLGQEMPYGYLHFRVGAVRQVTNLMENLLLHLLERPDSRRAIPLYTLGLLFVQLLEESDKLTMGIREQQSILGVLRYLENNYAGGSLTDDRMILGSEGDYRFYSYFDDWRMTLTDGGTWRITDCPADAGYQGQPLYEITFVNEANEELRFGLIINSNDVITLCTEEWEGSYERYEYSTYSNG